MKSLPHWAETLHGIPSGEKGPQLLFSTSKSPKSPFETERQREERLNKEIRMPLLAEYADPNDPSNLPCIIVSRACKYNKQVVNSLSTTEIQNIIKTPNDEHLDYFYLMITQYVPSTVALPSSIILAKLIPGNWKAVKPEATWPLTFIGNFPKKIFETEREREWRLNQEVRMPFKQYLVSLLSQGTQGMPEQQKFLQGLGPVVSSIAHLERSYVAMARALDATRHDMDLHGILPVDEGQLSEKLAECEDVLGDVMMDIRPKLAIMILVNSHSSRKIKMSLMNQVTSFAESTDDKELKRCWSSLETVTKQQLHHASVYLECKQRTM